MLNARINNMDCILYYDIRVSPEKAPLGYPYMYHVRHDEDDWTQPVSLERAVFVNFFGTVFMKQPVEFDDSGYIDIESFSMEKQFVKFYLSGSILKKMFLDK